MKRNLLTEINSILKFILTIRAVAVLFAFMPFAFLHAQSLNDQSIDTLAVVGNHVISMNDFIKAYKDKVMRVGLTDNGDTRYKYLMDMVNDQLLINRAKIEDMDKTKESRKEYKRTWMQELLNAYSASNIEPGIKITENDLKQFYRMLNTKIKVRHLYASTKQKADSLYSELMRGKTFKELAETDFEDPELRNNGGLLGYISVDEMDPAFEKAAFSMKVGEISKPVKTVEGYSIIKVLDIKYNPLTTESEYLKARERIRAFVYKRKYEEAAREFTKSEHEKLKIKFNKPFVLKIFNSLKQDSTENILENSSLINKNDLSRVVVTSAICSWDFHTLVKEMSITTGTQRQWIRTEENLEDFISGLIIRKYIIQSALKEKLDKAPSFKKNVDYSFDTYLLTQMDNKLRSGIKISDDSVKAYYEKNRTLFYSKPEIGLSSILVDDSLLAHSIKSLLQQGAGFSSLARKYSVQKITAQKGGDIGYFTEESLGGLGKEIFSLKIGEWKGPISEYGKFVFLKCTGHKAPVLKPLSKCSKDIEETLTTFNWFKIREAYTDKLKEEIPVKLFPEKLNALNLLTRAD